MLYACFDNAWDDGSNGDEGGCSDSGDEVAVTDDWLSRAEGKFSLDARERGCCLRM